jgi:hypothetical protein
MLARPYDLANHLVEKNQAEYGRKVGKGKQSLNDKAKAFAEEQKRKAAEKAKAEADAKAKAETPAAAITTPGTRVTWKNLSEWFKGLGEIEARRSSSERYSQIEAHYKALTERPEVINTAIDGKLLAEIRDHLNTKKKDPDGAVDADRVKLLDAIYRRMDKLGLVNKQDDETPAAVRPTAAYIKGLANSSIPFKGQPGIRRDTEKQKRAIVEGLGKAGVHPKPAERIVADALTRQASANRGGNMMFLQAQHLLAAAEAAGIVEEETKAETPAADDARIAQYRAAIDEILARGYTIAINKHTSGTQKGMYSGSVKGGPHDGVHGVADYTQEGARREVARTIYEREKAGVGVSKDDAAAKAKAFAEDQKRKAEEKKAEAKKAEAARRHVQATTFAAVVNNPAAIAAAGTLGDADARNEVGKLIQAHLNELL